MMKTRQIVAAVLLAGCLVSLPFASRETSPEPVPYEPTGIALRGLFVGPTASADAVTMSCLTAALADCLEYDGSLAEPRLKSGVAFDDLRVAARECRCKGESIGDRQVRARDAIAAYLDATLGPSGGPATPVIRAAWVSAFRDISRAAADATK